MMRRTTIDTSALLKPLLLLHMDDLSIDLHNDYDCVSLSYSSDKHLFSLGFRSSEHVEGTMRSLVIEFTECVILDVKITIEDQIGAMTLDNFHRARIETNGAVSDFSVDDRKSFVIEFCEDVAFELLAEEAVLCVSDAVDADCPVGSLTTL